jgi:hypothetical protein
MIDSTLQPMTFAVDFDDHLIDMPAPLTKMIPLKSRRTSTRSLPWLFGKLGGKHSNCSSVSQNKSLKRRLHN